MDVEAVRSLQQNIQWEAPSAGAYRPPKVDTYLSGESVAEGTLLKKKW